MVVHHGGYHGKHKGIKIKRRKFGKGFGKGFGKRKGFGRRKRKGFFKVKNSPQPNATW